MVQNNRYSPSSSSQKECFSNQRKKKVHEIVLECVKEKCIAGTYSSIEQFVTDFKYIHASKHDLINEMNEEDRKAYNDLPNIFGSEFPKMIPIFGRIINEIDPLLRQRK
jgi:hypothetical protein